MSDDAAAVAREIRAEAEAWRDWLTELRSQAVKVRTDIGLCGDTVIIPMEAAGARRYAWLDGVIPVEMPACNTAHYTAEGLREVILEPLRKRHAEAKAAVRECVLRYTHGSTDGQIPVSIVNTAFAALGLEPVRERTIVNVGPVYISWVQDSALSSEERDALIERAVGALASLAPDGAEILDSHASGERNAYRPSASVSASVKTA